jgi:hypothetical protein
MYTYMKLVGPNGEDCGRIRRHSFSAVMFASHSYGPEIGGEEGITIGEPVVLDPEISTALIPVLGELIKTFTNSNLELGNETEDVQILLSVLKMHGSCTLLYMKDDESAG